MPVVRVGVLTDNYPFSFRGDDGRIDGYSYELVAVIGQAMGLHFERIPGTTKEINQAFMEGRLDMIQSFARSRDREAMVDFSVPYLNMAGQFFVQKHGPDIRTWQDLQGLRVLVHRGSLGEHYLLLNGLSNSIVYVDSVEQAILRLDRGEGDVTLATRLTGLSIAQHLGLKNLRVLDTKIADYEVDYCLAVQKGNNELLARLNEGMAVLVRTGQADKLYQKWFGFVAPNGYTSEQILLAVSVGLALALGITIWAVWQQRRLGQRIARQSASLQERAEQLRLAVQVAISIRSFRSRTTRSVNKKPAANSRSWPGVRMVTATLRPRTRISSGSSTATRSRCATRRVPRTLVMRTARTRAFFRIRPAIFSGSKHHGLYGKYRYQKDIGSKVAHYPCSDRARAPAPSNLQPPTSNYPRSTRTRAL